jgi:hypothetical protein
MDVRINNYPVGYFRPRGFAMLLRFDSALEIWIE